MSSLRRGIKIIKIPNRQMIQMEWRFGNRFTMRNAKFQTAKTSKNISDVLEL